MHVERRCASFLSVGVLCVPATSSCQNSHALANAVCMITIQFLTITMTKNVKTFSIIVFLSDHRLYMCALAYMTSAALCHQPNIARTKLCTALSLHAELAWNDTEQVLDSFSRYYFRWYFWFALLPRKHDFRIHRCTVYLYITLMRR